MTALPTDRLTYEEAAELLDPAGKEGVTVRTIRRLVEKGVLQKVRIGRHPTVFKKELLALALEGSCRHSTGPASDGETKPSSSGDRSTDSLVSFAAKRRQQKRPPKRNGRPSSGKSATIGMLHRQRFQT
jgi:excisionase family DNA binding protein